MRRLIASLLVVIVAVLGFPAPASAHGQLAYSEPGNQTTVNAPLERVALYFTEAPTSGAVFTVTSPSGKSVLSGWSHGEPKQLEKPVQELNLVAGKWEPVFYNTGFPALVAVSHLPEQGVYSVHYESTASDGDKVKGDVRFDYQGPMTTAPPVVTLPNPQSSSTAWIWWTAGAVVLIGIAAWFLLHKRRPAPAIAKNRRRP